MGMTKIQSVRRSHFRHLWSSDHSSANGLIEHLSYLIYLLEWKRWRDVREHLLLNKHSLTPPCHRFQWIHAWESLTSKQAMRTSFTPIENINDVSITSDDYDEKPRRDIHRRSQKAFNIQDAQTLKVHNRSLSFIFIAFSLLFKARYRSIVQENDRKTLHFRSNRWSSW